MAKYIQVGSDGSLQEVQPVSSSAGASDAGKMAQLDSNGRFDLSTMPTGIGADTITVTASEALAAGDFVDVFDDAGTASARKANATDSTKPAEGFVRSAVSSGAPAVVYLRGINDAVPLSSFGTGDVGKAVFLSITAGSCTLTPPSGSGNIVQFLGRIVACGATVSVNFSQHPHVVRV